MRNLLAGVVGLLALFIIYSCQKEVSLEYGTPAKGSLQGDGGDCLPKLVGGSFIANKALTDSNFLEVTVDVIAPGPYNITTDSVNGFIFKASGTFANIGPNTIKLKGTGVPENAGVNNFTVVFDSSYCEVAITVLPAGSTGGPAVFTLQGAPGACTAFDLDGNYIKDTTLDGRHTVKVNVNVTTVGTYSISTTTQNGYFFSANSTFGATGLVQVTLQGVGKPLAAGTDNFTVTGGTSNCTFPVTVTATGTPPAGACSGTPQGTYTAGTALAAGNTIVVPHTYATAGPYTVSTNTVNGYSFSSGSINATAGTATNITLTGTGTPTAAGTNTFTISFGDGQTCTFTVTVNPATPVVNNDYFPTTANSYWTYKYDVAADDTFKVTNAGPVAVYSGNTYQRFVYTDDGGPFFEEFYRKNAAGEYYQSIDTAGFGANGFTFTQPRLDLLFLKNTLASTDSLISDFNSVFNSGAGAPIPGTFRVKYKVVNANTSITVNGKNFTNVHQLRLTLQFGVGGTFIDLGSGSDPNDYYYARGVGLIKWTDGSDFQDIRFWQVN